MPSEASRSRSKRSGERRRTVTELADRAGVSRATVFGRFGSKLGVLEALAVRCAGGPQMRAIREAVKRVLGEMAEGLFDLAGR